MARPKYTGTKKNASSSAFYAGFASGFISSIEGLLLFFTQGSLRSLLRESLEPLRNAQILYVIACVAIFLLAREPEENFWKLFWTFWRYGRMVTVFISVVLDRNHRVNSKMFFATLRIRDAPFAAALQEKTPAKRTTRDKIKKFKRVAKITAIRGTAALVKYLVPEANIVLGPALKFVSIRPVLGTAMASAVAAVHFMPDSLLEHTLLDDVLASFAEAIVDAEDQGRDSTIEFYKRLDTPEAKVYFHNRFRGYLTGSGFWNSLLMQIPFLGVPMTVVSRCAAATVVRDIVERNLEKDNRTPFPCEDMLSTSAGDGDMKQVKHA